MQRNRKGSSEDEREASQCCSRISHHAVTVFISQPSLCSKYLFTVTPSMSPSCDKIILQLRFSLHFSRLLHFLHPGSYILASTSPILPKFSQKTIIPLPPSSSVLVIHSLHFLLQLVTHFNCIHQSLSFLKLPSALSFESTATPCLSISASTCIMW